MTRQPLNKQHQAISSNQIAGRNGDRPDTTGSQRGSSEPSVLARLRRLSPRRGLDLRSALGVAERQAALFLKLASHDNASPVPLRCLQVLPRIELATSGDLPISGASFWTGSVWRLEANRSDHPNRQRFTFFHEFKHVIDHPECDLLYSKGSTRERVSDHFAACVLMPRIQIIRAWCSGEQSIDRLADQFAVSREAMTRRVTELGLFEQTASVPATQFHKHSGAHLSRTVCFRGNSRDRGRGQIFAPALRSSPALAIAGSTNTGENL